MTDQAVVRSVRSPWQVTWSVWQALFLREFMTRVTKDRMAWFWMLFEPIALIAVMVAIRTVVLGRNQEIAGADYVPWMLVGLLGFFLFRENMQRSIGAVEKNSALYTYRQIKPVDPVAVVCFLEGVLKTFIFILFVAVGELLAIELFPDSFLYALFGWLSMWLLGLGIGVFVSALSSLVPEIGKVIRIASLPLLIISGVILPLNYLPHDMLQYLLLNPIAHGLEVLRVGFFDGYRPVQGVDPIYLWYWIVGLLSIGLMLHLRFEMRLKAQ
jgi:capsular polysaccharide transport system permease protein